MQQYTSDRLEHPTSISVLKSYYEILHIFEVPSALFSLLETSYILVPESQQRKKKSYRLHKITYRVKGPDSGKKK